MKHLKYGGSTAARTLACAGWIKASKDIPKSPPGDAAITGSMHHEVMERCQRDGVEPKQCLGLVYKEKETTREFTEDDLTLSEIAYQATNTVLEELDIDELEIEPFVQLIEDEAGGYVDLLGLSEDRHTLMILDYKFGRGKVDVEESAQHALYAVSSRADKKTKDLWEQVKDIVFVIIQPQLKGGVFTWHTDLKWLKDFKNNFVIAMGSDELHSGSHCKWCPAAPYCPVKRADVIGAKKLGARIKKELQEGADILGEVEDWVNSMKQELFTQLTRGVSIKGWKIVEKKPTRKWIDEKEAEQTLIEARIRKSIFTRTKLLTAVQTITAFKKNDIDFDLDKLIEVKSAGTTLAPEHDDRDAVEVNGVPDNLKKLVGNPKSKTKKEGKKDNG